MSNDSVPITIIHGTQCDAGRRKSVSLFVLLLVLVGIRLQGYLLGTQQPCEKEADINKQPLEKVFVLFGISRSR